MQYNYTPQGQGAQGGPPPPPKNYTTIGLILLIIGAVFLLKQFDFFLPGWITSWQMLLIVVGLFIGIQKNFTGVGWIICVMLGALSLINNYFLDGSMRRFMEPLFLIGLGIYLILRNNKTGGGLLGADSGQPINEDYVQSTSIFGGTKKRVFSKNFTGGRITTVFGGIDLDLMQADTAATAVIDLTVLFGGTTIIVPANWAVISNAVTIFGDVKDRRVYYNAQQPAPSKTLVLRGTVLFGGIDIKSY